MKVITLTIDDYDIAGPSYAIVCDEAQIDAVSARLGAVVTPELYKFEVLNIIDAANEVELSELIEELKIEAAEFAADTEAIKKAEEGK